MIVQNVSVYFEMMLLDNKFLLFISISVVLISLYYIWPILFVYLLILFFIYYDFNPETDNIQGHGLNKVKKLIVKVRIFTAQTIPSLYFTISNNFESEYNNYTSNKKMFTSNMWDNKNRNVMTPQNPCRGSKVISGMGKHTSTPITSPIYKGADLTSNGLMVKHNRIKRPERYSLSDTSFNTRQNTSLDCSNSSISIPNAAGPLLATSGYNIGMGTYADSKSPGLTSRIVRYSTEYDDSFDRNKNRITHLPQYGSPGLFPIVNLNKTPLKTVKPTTNRPVTVRIAPPDNTPYSTVDRSLILSNSYHSPNSQTSPTQSEISTRSVLDALKEISRKRIHARDSTDRNKRQRKNSLSMQNSPEKEVMLNSIKRGRDNEILNNSDSFNGLRAGSSPSPKKQKYGYSDIISSLSSSIHLKQNGSKRKSDVTQKEPDVNKQIKLGAPKNMKPPETFYNSTTNSMVVQDNRDGNKLEPCKEATVDILEKDKETLTEQTKNDQSPDNRKKITNQGAIVNENGVCRLTFISNPPEKQDDVFVPFKPPTEESKRKRLAVLLGALSGEDWDVKALTKKFFPDDKEPPVQDMTDSPKGILSSPGTKVDIAKKHVTFSLPSTSISTLASTPTSASASTSTPEKTTLPNSVSTVSEPDSNAKPNDSMGFTNTMSNSTGNSFINKRPDNTSTSRSITQPISSSFSFGSSSPPSSMTLTNSINSTNFSHYPSKPMEDKTTVTTSNSSSLIENVNNASNASKPTFQFSMISPSTNNLTFTPSKTTEPNIVSTAVAATQLQNTVSFGSNASTNVSTPTLNTTTPQPAINTKQTTPNKTVGGFYFDLNKKTESSNTSSFTTSAPLISNTAPASTFSFGTPKTEESKSTSIISPFGGTPKTSNITTVTPSAMFAFGSSSANNPTTTFSFTNSTTTQQTTQTTAPIFGISTNSTSLNSNVQTTPSTTVAFGASTTDSNKPVFGIQASNTPAFGVSTTASNIPAFGTSTTNVPAFGSAISNTTNSGVFGSKPLSTTSTGFGTSTAFGTITTSISSPFSSSVSTTQATVGFGTPNTTSSSVFAASSATFGTPSTTTTTFGPAVPVFNTTTASSSPFGAPNTTSAFGVSTTTPAFGTPSTTSSGFGTSSTSVFGANQPGGSVFGAATTTTASSSTFGTPVTGTSTIFGTSNTSAFGGNANAAPFGTATDKPSTFGSPSFGTSGFGTSTTSSNSFGTTNAFGSSTTAGSGFGNTSTNIFNSTDNKPPAFGTTSPTFGAPTQNNMFNSQNQTNPSVTSNSIFGSTNQNNTTFGTTSTDNNQAAFSSGFGNAPSTNSAPSTGVFAFGSSNAAASSSTSTNNNAFQFGAPKPPAPGGFNFTAGSTNTGPAAFNANSTFAASNFAGNQFSPPSGNMFSIGTGSTAPRPRSTTRHRKK